MKKYISMITDISQLNISINGTTDEHQILKQNSF